MRLTHARAPRTVLGVLLGVLLAPLAACGSTGSDSSGGRPTDSSLTGSVSVTGAFGQRPTIRIHAPLDIPRTDTWTSVRGTGDTVGVQSTSIIALTLADARTGRTAISTFDTGQRPLEVKPGEQIFPVLSTALAGRQAGSRLVLATTADDAYGSQGAPQIGVGGGDGVVMVADVLATDPNGSAPGPSGVTRATPAGAPRLLGRATRPTGFSVAGLRKPSALRVWTLKAGTGDPITGPSRVRTDYLGEVWGARTPFDETYSRQPVTVSVGTGSVVRAWDEALRGQREGARVLVVAPPSTAYGASGQSGIPARSTLVFVIDVLGVG